MIFCDRIHKVWSDVELDPMEQKSHFLRNSANQLRDEAQKKTAQRREMKIKGRPGEEKVWYALLFCSDLSTLSISIQYYSICFSQLAVTDSWALRSSGHDLVSESVNMTTVPLLMAKDQSPGEEEESEDSLTGQDGISVSSVSGGLAFYEDMNAPVRPASDSLREESIVTQTREDDFILSLRTLNCSPEILESVQKFLSWDGKTKDRFSTPENRNLPEENLWLFTSLL